jgi:uracil phosphoribosyltransferase
MMVHDLSQTNSIFNTFIAELRNKDIQTDAMRFRKNLERVGEIMAYEISKKLHYHEQETETPLGIALCSLLNEQPVIAVILRAGLPMHQGMINCFDRAETAFVSAYRKHKTAEIFDIKVEYLASPSIANKDLIICDPMLATGSSMMMVYKALLQNGAPKSIHIAAAIASKEALKYLREKLPEKTNYWLGAIDDELTAQSYIVPGIGDAGDLAYGQKN